MGFLVYSKIDKNLTTGSAAVKWPHYWAVAELLGKLPANDPTRVVESNVTVDEVNSKFYAGIPSTAKKIVQQVPDYW